MASARASLASRASLMLWPVSKRSMPGDVSEMTATSMPASSMSLSAGLAQLEQLVDDHVAVGLAGAGEVEEPPVLAHRVVPELREVLVGVERVHPALSGEVDLEVDRLHLAVPCVIGRDRECRPPGYQPARRLRRKVGGYTLLGDNDSHAPGRGDARRVRERGSAAVTDRWAIYDELLAGIPEDLRIRRPSSGALVRGRIRGDRAWP